MQLGYCTNVHPGMTLDEIETQLDEHALEVRGHLDLDVLPLGLWLPASVVESVDVEELGRRLSNRGLQVFTMNAFPYGDFHGEHVKHAVYEPDWATPARSRYTLQCARLLASLLGSGSSGGISTLPLGWAAAMDTARLDAACTNLLELVQALADLESETGCCIHVDIEPEPGCAIGTMDELAACFEEKLLGKGQDELVHRHIRACIDLCHAAVMFEDLKPIQERLQGLGLLIGKVQVSNAIEVDFEPMDHARRLAAAAALSTFDEPRWMHQVVIQHDGNRTFHEDLGEALREKPAGCWRVHFHVPVHVSSLGPLGTTQQRLINDLQLLASSKDVANWEVETYAWDALPEDRRVSSLARSIADELTWTRNQLCGEDDA